MQQQQQQSKAAEGDRLLLLLPPAVQSEEEGLLRDSDPWAASKTDSSQAGMKLQEALDFSAHLQSRETLHSQHNPPMLGTHPSGDTVNRSTVHSSKDLQETVSCDGAEEQQQPSGKETLSHPLQDESLVNKAACSNPSLATESLATAQECLRDMDIPSQQDSCLQGKTDSPSQNCCLGLEATSGESPEDDQANEASPPTEEEKLKPGAKHVTFPSDEDIVSGAVEPKDPWRHGKEMSTLTRIDLC